MKTIEVDEELYRYIASQTLHIGESASEILRRLLALAPHHGVKSATIPAMPSDMAHSVESSPNRPDVSDFVELLNGEEFVSKESAIDRFMLLLTALYQASPEAFVSATEIKGRKRVYFAKSEEELQANGKTTKPRAVPGTPYWVISNTNTSRKRYIVEQLMTTMGYPAELIELACAKI
ncbi:MAG: replication initiation negative regulator SeqA [Aeromonadaceae bacterium]